MKVLVFNCGLLRLRGCCGCGELLANPPHADARFQLIPFHIAECGADIIALSEIYEDEHVRRLLEVVREVYPYHARGDARRGLEKVYKFHNGLLFLSKYPISESRIVKHRRAASLEEKLGSKSMLVMKLDVGELGKIVMVNMHATAGGSSLPEQVDDVREDELREAVEACDVAMGEGFKAIILGDMNCGPQASAENYNFFLQHGYVDEVAACAPNPDTLFTWDPQNPLNVGGPHEKCAAQRCDHVFVHRDAGITGKQMKLVFTESIVRRDDGVMSTLSDHYGVLLELQLAV